MCTFPVTRCVLPHLHFFYRVCVLMMVYFLAGLIRIHRYACLCASCHTDLYSFCGLRWVLWYYVHFLWAFCCDMCTLPVVCTCVAIFDSFCELCVVICVHFLLYDIPAGCVSWYLLAVFFFLVFFLFSFFFLDLHTSDKLYVVIFVHFLRTVCCDICTLPAGCTLYTSCWLCVLVFALSQEFC